MSPVACVLTAAVIFAAVAWLAFHRAKKSAADIAGVIRRLAQGDPASRARVRKSGIFAELGAAVNLLADRVQSQRDEFFRDKPQLASILSSMAEGVVAADRSGRIILINPAMCRLFGLDGAAAVGRPFPEVLRHNQLNELLRTIQSTGERRVDEIRIFSPEELVFEARAVPLVRDNISEGALLILHDITRIRKLESVRRDFVANVSHELRTPLASIKGYAETLKSGAMDDPAIRVEFIDTIEKHADRLSRLVDDLLDLSAIESGRRSKQIEPVSLRNIAAEVAQSLFHQSNRKRVAVDISIAESFPPIQADRGQMKQVFTNLIENAIKFNKEGGKVFVRASAGPEGTSVEVADTGMGIPAGDIPRIFERFYRVDKARSRELGGTGLGLAIVKHLVESHGGRVSVESVEDEGTTIRFQIPN